MLQRIETFLKVERIRRRFLRHVDRGYVDLSLEELQWILDRYESVQDFLDTTIGWYMEIEGETQNINKTFRYHYKVA